ncbi:MAG: hypothetical protein R3C68_13055 [Myxococcota bacterium]
MGSFFIGVAPLAGGGALIGLVILWMLGGPSSTSSQQLAHLLGHLPNLSVISTDSMWYLASLLEVLLAGTWRNATGWMPLQLYLLGAVAAHMAPSGRDLQNGAWGLVATIFVLLGWAALATLFGHTTSLALAVLAPTLLVFLTASIFQGIYTLLIAMVFNTLQSRRGPRRVIAGA